MVTLENERLEGFFNDENNPIKDINEETIINMIKIGMLILKKHIIL